MKRGELYRVASPSARDPKKFRVFVILSRQVLIDSRFSTVVCAPIYSTHDGLSTQVLVGVNEGLRHDSSIHCDELVSLPKSFLTNFVGSLSPQKIEELNSALSIALDIRD
ncbi:MAG: type II toxin-antitoxin system PemK/MazF family toxin [Deltaproteobacteria bacterium]|nr:type II toxin-antitoxin system PemK/MazF family toxin [Deltaproteobacteria bacterium]